MAYVSPTTGHNPVTGNAIPASWGDDVNAAADFLATNKPHCEAYSTSVQSIANATATDVTFGSENFDIGGIHSTATNTDRFTIPAGEGGKYDIVAGTQFASDVDGYRQVKLTKNGADLTPARLQVVPASGSSGIALQVAALAVPLVAADIIRLQVLHTAGAALDIDESYLTIKWVAT